MDHIRQALNKARAGLDEGLLAEAPETPVAIPLHQRPAPAARPAPAWTPRKVSLNADYVARQRIVSHAMSDPGHVPFNLLRTRVRKALKDNGWKTVAVTSPTPGCGKTMVAINLALSLARTPDCRTVLIDLDLRKPAVAKTLGLFVSASLGRCLERGALVEDCFVEVGENLLVGLNDHPVKHSAEMMQSQRVIDLISTVSASFAPDVILFDLPPMGTCDDALAFLPRVDSALLVAAAGTTTAPQIEECERQISDKLLGIVLNKSESDPRDYYY